MSEPTPLGEWRCASCGEVHDELPAAAFKAPDVWFDASADQRAKEFELTSDICIWRDEHFYVRCTLSLPLADRDGTMDFGLWSSLSPENFDRYMERYDSPDRVNLGPMFGWLSNRLPGYPDTINLKCMVHPLEPDFRPSIELEPTDHPLSIHQRRGIAFEDAVAYFHEHLEL